MLRYLIISSVFNLFFFSLLSLILYHTGELNARLIEKTVTPIVVRLATVQKQEAQLNLSTAGEKSSTTAVSINEKTTPKDAGKSKPKANKPKERKPSLLEELLPQVEKLVRTQRTLAAKASVKINKKGKAELNFNRKVVYVPPVKPIEVSLPPAPAVVKITVLPDGRVVSAVFIKRTGNAKVDEAVIRFLKNLRFEPIKENRIEEITVKVVFSF